MALRLPIAGALAATLLALTAPSLALAHPLGNFTVNRYARLEVSPQAVRVRYVLDMAEIPTFQAMPTLDANRDGAVSEAERHSYARKQAADLAKNLELMLGTDCFTLRPTHAEVELLPGQGGLQTLRLTAWLEAPGAAERLASLTSRAPEQPASVTLRDNNDPSKVGWREMLVRAKGLSLASAVPDNDLTDELRTYPTDLLQLPLDVRALLFSVSPGSAAPAVAKDASVAAQRNGASLDRTPAALANLVSSVTLTPVVIAGALVAAVVFGAMHAMSPGHGKTIVAAYLVGARGTARHALFLGLTVTVVHTAGVFALLLVTLFASHYVLPEQVFPWMSLLSGLLVLSMGASLVRRRLAEAKGAVVGHGHEHVPAGATLTWRQLLALGVSGGLLPCPSATVLGLGAIALNRVAYGLVLIVAFSAGLAATLVAVGLAMVYSGRLAGRLRLLQRVTGAMASGGAATGSAFLRLVRLVPVGSASVVAIAGLALTGEALGQLDAPARLASAWAAVSLDVARAAVAVQQVSSLALLGTALTLGLRHGIDWDHLAAITDITVTSRGETRVSARAAYLASLYAVGHALVVALLGLAALVFGAILPAWVDPLMERLVGLTLVFLGAWVVYSLLRSWRGGESVRLQSRWMLLFAGVRRAWGAVEQLLHGHPHSGPDGTPLRAHAHRLDGYGAGTAFGTGVIHGIGAETGTQVLLLAAVGGAAGQGLGIAMLIAFTAGLLVSNTAVALLASLGFVSSRRARTLYGGVAALTAGFSLVVGGHALLGLSDRLPDLQMALSALVCPIPT